MKLFKTILKGIFMAFISLILVACIMGLLATIGLHIPVIMFCILLLTPVIVFILVLKYPDSIVSTTPPASHQSMMFDEHNPASPRYNLRDPTNPSNPTGFFNPISPLYIFRNSK